LKKFFVALLSSLLIASSLTACAPTGLQSGTEISIALTNDFNSTNADNVTNDAALAVNREVSALLNPSFFHFDEAGVLVPNDEFGSVTILGKNPLRVEYALTGKAKWSDGVPVSADDLLLSWLAARNPLEAGFESVRAGSGLKWTTSVPKVSSDKKSLTVTYDRAVADWQDDLTINAAAHLVAMKAFALADASAALTRFEQAVQTANLEDQELIAEQYSGLYLARGTNQLQHVSSGPYFVTAHEPGQSLTLKANRDFSWGPLPTIETVQIKFYPDATAMLAAMQAGEVDICAPAESGIATNGDLISLAKSAGAKYEFSASNNIEAVLLNFSEQSVFQSASTEPEKQQALREAFIKLIPRAKILSALSTDNPVIEAKSWFYSNGSNYYAPFVQSNGSSDFLTQNAEAAAELLESANISRPVDIRVLFDSNNPRAKQEFALLSQYANSVGFNLVDVSTKDPRTVSSTGEFDVLIATVALAGETAGDPYWFTGGSATAFEDAELDQLLIDYSSKSESLDQIAVLKTIDARLYATQFGLPLYQVPALLVYGKRIKTVVSAPYGGTATYGYWNWALNG
jgi:peptide/nickel transport system substrate-binding protein